MNRRKANYVVNVLLVISFMSLFITGIIKLPGLLGSMGIGRSMLPIGLISSIHDTSGVVLGFLVFAHILLNWRFFLRRRVK